jgi:hypothetical protein
MSDANAKPTPNSTPSITSANLPKPPVEAVQTVDIATEQQIIGRPLVDADFTNIKPKNPMHSFYFGNHKANKASDGGSGLRIEDLLARGFEFATPQDVLVPDGKGGYKPLPTDSALVRNGRVVRGDLMLLKIDKIKYQSALKYNAENATARVSRAANVNAARNNLAKGMREESVSLRPQDRGKISFYNPNSSEREGL